MPRIRKTQYRMPDGRIFRAASAEELVTQMRNSSFAAVQDLNDYMTQAAKRAYVVYGVTICSWAPDLFLQDLLRYKIVTVVETH